MMSVVTMEVIAHIRKSRVCTVSNNFFSNFAGQLLN